MPLSDTIVSGNPNLAKSSCNIFVVFVVRVVHLKTSGHFVKLSKYVPFYRLVGWFGFMAYQPLIIYIKDLALNNLQFYFKQFSLA